MATEVTRLGIVGCGGISHAHAGAAAAAGGAIRFVACCDVRAPAARNWAAKYACDAAYADIETMLAAEPLDGVVLATWPAHHQEHVARCLAAGAKHILCEKALTLSGELAATIWRQARDARATVIEAFMYRHHPAIARLNELLAGGELGSLDSIRATFSVPHPEKAAADDPNRNWRQQAQLGGGVEFDLACYALNACNHFAAARPVRVYARGDRSATYGTISRLHAMIEYANGCVGAIESSGRADLSQELQLVCAAGRLTLPIAWSIYDAIEIAEVRSTRWVAYEHRAHPVAKANSYQLQLENFAEVIHGRAEPAMPLIESVANACTMDAVLASARSCEAVAVALPDWLAAELQSRQTWRAPA